MHHDLSEQPYIDLTLLSEQKIKMARSTKSHIVRLFLCLILASFLITVIYGPKYNEIDALISPEVKLKPADDLQNQLVTINYAKLLQRNNKRPSNSDNMVQQHKSRDEDATSAERNEPQEATARYVKEDFSEIKGNYRGCSCRAKPKNFNPSGLLSTCNQEAEYRGLHQKVVSYGLHGNMHSIRGYWEGIELNAKDIQKFYPGWTMRLYYDVDPHDTGALQLLCKLQCRYSFIDLCYIRNVPGFGNMYEFVKNAWRFFAIADPYVDVYLSRDLDSRITSREKAAVDEWLQTNLTMHVMRDTVLHLIPVLAGMWGAQVYTSRELLSGIMKEMVANGSQGEPYYHDQTMMENIMWPKMKDNVMQHDSYACFKFRSHGHMRPWPTRRELVPYNFIGSRYGLDKKPLTAPCPLACRPPNHQDWTIC